MAASGPGAGLAPDLQMRSVADMTQEATSSPMGKCSVLLEAVALVVAAGVAHDLGSRWYVKDTTWVGPRLYWMFVLYTVVYLYLLMVNIVMLSGFKSKNGLLQICAALVACLVGVGLQFALLFYGVYFVIAYHSMTAGPLHTYYFVLLGLVTFHFIDSCVISALTSKDVDIWEQTGPDDVSAREKSASDVPYEALDA
eukprot:TRINITY_DN40772_c0_g1_i1.p1 TRINITY_DN40772_c0_g1~~TRINITY_DN40772_c0_g1_i1.p1  ORF type:complete len:197 (-),score=21.49 TRINITY_DN40772_c0_g1_i1:92-682(-)